MAIVRTYHDDREFMEAAGRITCEAINSLERECIAPVDYEAHYTEVIEYAAAEVYPDASDPKFVRLSEECHMRVARDIVSKGAWLLNAATLMAEPVSKAVIEAVVERLVNRRGIRREVALEAAQEWITREMASNYVDAMFRNVCENEGW